MTTADTPQNAQSATLPRWLLLAMLGGSGVVGGVSGGVSGGLTGDARAEVLTMVHDVEAACDEQVDQLGASAAGLGDRLAHEAREADKARAGLSERVTLVEARQGAMEAMCCGDE